MSSTECKTLVKDALDQLVTEINENSYEDMNEATIQHHLALNIHLLAIEKSIDIKMTLEKRVFLKGGKISDIDVFLKQRDGTRCAIELKFFKRENSREPNNRYDAYIDIGSLELYLEAFSDIGFFVLLTDHPHYYDPNFKELSARTSDFSLRNGVQTQTGVDLCYRTKTPHGPPITLKKSYRLIWENLDETWKLLFIIVE
ncbi:MAG: hypothetical protein V3V02_10630 [Rhizobiaceae bacterium]